MIYNYTQTSCTVCLKPLTGSFYLSNSEVNFPVHITGSFCWPRPVFPWHSPSFQYNAKWMDSIRLRCLFYTLAALSHHKWLWWLKVFAAFLKWTQTELSALWLLFRIFIWASAMCVCEREACILLSLPHFTCCPTATASPDIPCLYSPLRQKSSG